VSYITWSEKLNTGITVIDKQHRRIVDLINELHLAHERGSGRDAIGKVIRAMIDYTITHFTFEEELQSEAGYQFSKAHKRVHEMFIKKVLEYEERFKAGEDIALEVSEMLQKWLVNHIKSDDEDYVPVVRRKLSFESERPSGWLAGALGRFFGGQEA
jgi:hemerythrin